MRLPVFLAILLIALQVRSSICIEVVFDQGLDDTTAKAYDDLLGNWFAISGNYEVLAKVQVERFPAAAETLAEAHRYAIETGAGGVKRRYSLTVHEIEHSLIACLQLNQKGNKNAFTIALLYPYMARQNLSRADSVHCVPLGNTSWLRGGLTKNRLESLPALAHEYSSGLALAINRARLSKVVGDAVLNHELAFAGERTLKLYRNSQDGMWMLRRDMWRDKAIVKKRREVDIARWSSDEKAPFYSPRERSRLDSAGVVMTLPTESPPTPEEVRLAYLRMHSLDNARMKRPNVFQSAVRGWISNLKPSTRRPGFVYIMHVGVYDPTIHSVKSLGGGSEPRFHIDYSIKTKSCFSGIAHVDAPETVLSVNWLEDDSVINLFNAVLSVPVTTRSHDVFVLTTKGWTIERPSSILVDDVLKARLTLVGHAPLAGTEFISPDVLSKQELTFGRRNKNKESTGSRRGSGRQRQRRSSGRR